MITEDYVSFETAKLLKEKGFDADIITYRDDFIQHGSIVVPLQETLSKDCIKTPTLQMAMKWLRKIHNIIIVPTQYHKYMKKKVCDEFYYGCLIFKLNTDCPLSNDNFLNKKYEKSCDSAIKYCLENLI